VKFVYLRKNSKLTVLNMGYKLDLLQPMQGVFAWNIPLELMKFVYLHSTYVLSVLIIGLNITCTNSTFC